MNEPTTTPPPPHLIVDAHLDLAYTALVYGRSLIDPIATIRAREGKRPRNGVAAVSLPDLREAGAVVVFGTLFVMPASTPVKIHSPQVYHHADEAHRQAMAQLDYYHRLADERDDVRLIGDVADLDAVLAAFTEEGPEQYGRSAQNGRILGIVPLMEGADPVREPEELELWYERGLRIIGPAWDDTRYAAGAWRDGRHAFSADGHRLLEIMADLGFILDLTHLSEKATLEALERYPGTIVATHSNARALVPGERQFSDSQIRLLGERDGMIGIALFNPFLRAGHQLGDPKHRVSLTHAVAHIDHICQLLGDAKHVGIGSDMDGGFGAADIPQEMDTVRDLPKLAALLQQKGYADEDIAGIMGQNWISLLRRAWR